ncbi:MAG: ABC transporter permease, partial [Phycisphaerales bacterium]|nr:ABC transporter permease [Phycisphaerales bacterium]
MMLLRFSGYIRRQITRHRMRTLLTATGVGIAMFMFTAVQSMHAGVTEATTASAEETTLVVYRRDRYCPATSQLPQIYESRIERLDGVTRVIPMKVVVSNCRTSLDTVTFRGVPKERFIAHRGEALHVVDGSLDDWIRRGDASIIGETLAKRRGLRAGMTFDAAGIMTTVAAVMRSDLPQDQNVAYTGLEFVQLAGRDQLGVVTQFNVQVSDPALLDSVSEGIDAMFRAAQDPTATFTEKAFVGRIVDDIVELVGFARWLGFGCLLAVLALVGNAIVLSVQSRIAEHAILQTLGCSPRLLAGLIIAEGAMVAGIGGSLGIAAAALGTHLGG